MVNLDLGEILQKLQMTMSDTAIRATIVKEVIYRASNLLSVGANLIPTVNINKLDGIFTWPSEMDAVEELAEGVEGNLDQIVWSKYGFSLKKYRKAFMLTDEAEYRGIGQIQNQTSIKRVAEAFAKKEDADIIDAIVAGAPTGSSYKVTIGAGNEWNSGNATVDIVADIIKARGIILHNSNVQPPEIRNLGLLVGTNVSSYLMELNLINNVQQTIEQYLKTAYGITLYESRDTDLADNAYLMIPGEGTGRHLVFDIPGANLVEQGRVMGVGQKYMVTKYFATKIEPLSESVATSPYRIVKIENTAA
jgi:hypothetical protein